MCQPALTEIQPINFIRCLDINVRACTKQKNMKFRNFLYEASLVESIFKGLEFGIWEKSGKFL